MKIVSVPLLRRRPRTGRNVKIVRLVHCAVGLHIGLPQYGDRLMDGQLFIGFHHYALRSPDLPKSVAFLETLGFRQVHDWELPHYGIDQAVMMQAADNKSWNGLPF